MRTYDSKHIIKEILSLFINSDKNELSIDTNKDNQKILIKYLEKEFFNLESINELMESIKYNRAEMINIFYFLTKSFLNENNNILNKTHLLINKASKDGFDWQSNIQCFKKVEEEVLELKQALNDRNKANIIEELGDVLFTLNCFAKLSNINLMECLTEANNKFDKRYTFFKKILKKEKLNIKTMSNKKKEEIWSKAKKKL